MTLTFKSQVRIRLHMFGLSFGLFLAHCFWRFIFFCRHPSHGTKKKKKQAAPPPAPTRPRCLLKASGPGKGPRRKSPNNSAPTIPPSTKKGSAPAVLSVCRCLPGESNRPRWHPHRWGQWTESLVSSWKKPWRRMFHWWVVWNLRDPSWFHDFMIWFKTSGWHIIVSLQFPESSRMWKGLDIN